MKIDEKDIKNLFVNMVLEKKIKKNTYLEKTPFHVPLLKNKLNKNFRQKIDKKKYYEIL